MDKIKILGQISPAAATPTSIYTVPSVTSTVVSTLVVCNRNAVSRIFRINVRENGEATSDKGYLFYGTEMAANTTITVTIGMTLTEGDIVEAYASGTGVSFNLFGVETTT